MQQWLKFMKYNSVLFHSLKINEKKKNTRKMTPFIKIKQRKANNETWILLL